MSIIRPIRYGSALVIGAVAWMAPTRAQAHFYIETPTNWVPMSSNGTPQKAAPCGNEGVAPGDAAAIPVTSYTPNADGSTTITIQFRETVTHPGHYRVALAADQASLPMDPVVTAGSTPCGSAAIETVTPGTILPDGVLADGVLVHTAAFPKDPDGGFGEQSIQVTVPASVSCPQCTLQVVEFMSNHQLNNPGGCIYHHCAEISISGHDGGTGPGQADAGGDTSTTGGEPDAGHSAGDAATGGFGGGGGCLVSGGGSGSMSGALVSLVAVGAWRRRKRHA